MAVEERAAAQRRERQGEPPGPRLGGEEFFEQHRAARHLGGAVILDDGRDFVAEREQAARLEADDRHAARRIGCERREGALGLLPRFVDAADGEEGAAAAQRSRAAVGRRRDLDAVAAGAQDAERSAQVFRLEVAVEGVGEEDDVAGFGREWSSAPLPQPRPPRPPPRPSPASGGGSWRSSRGTSRCASVAGCGARRSRRGFRRARRRRGRGRAG